MSSDYFDARVRTDEPAEALAWLQTQYGRVDLRVDDGSFGERAVGDCGFALRRLLWDCRAEVVYGADRFFFATSTPGYAWRVGSATGEFSVEPGVIQPGDEMVGHADGTAVEMVAFDAVHLTEAARAIYGDDTLEVRFDGRGPVSPRMRDYWLATLRWSFTQLPLLGEPLVRAHAHRALVSATLEAFPLVGDPRERRASALEQSSIYATATRWMDDHASLPVTADDAARAAGTSAAGCAGRSRRTVISPIPPRPTSDRPASALRTRIWSPPTRRGRPSPRSPCGGVSRTSPCSHPPTAPPTVRTLGRRSSADSAIAVGVLARTLGVLARLVARGELHVGVGAGLVGARTGVGAVGPLVVDILARSVEVAPRLFAVGQLDLGVLALFGSGAVARGVAIAHDAPLSW